MSKGLEIESENFSRLRANEQREVLYKNVRELMGINRQVKIQWYWLSALTLGLASFFTWIVNWIMNK